MDLSAYKTLVFDCDGVILNSNKIKTQAFYNTALPYGTDKAQKFVKYHIKNGGISRYSKFEVFLSKIVKQPGNTAILEQLLKFYSCEVRHGLLNCEVSSGLEALREKTAHAKWMVVSGGDQTELRAIFVQRKMDHIFDGGIYGSPDNKDSILDREIGNGNLIKPALFLGDSRYDYEAGVRAGLDFIFVAGWTELNEWEIFCQQNRIPWVRGIADLHCLH